MTTLIPTVGPAVLTCAVTAWFVTRNPATVSPWTWPLRIILAAGLILLGTSSPPAATTTTGILVTPPPQASTGDNTNVNTDTGKIREFSFQKMTVRVHLDKSAYNLDTPEFGGANPQREPILPTLPPPTQTQGGMTSAAILAQKAKQFDDGLYAAVELAAQNGAGTFPGKTRMLSAVAKRINARADLKHDNLLKLVLFSAGEMGGIPDLAPPESRSAVAQHIQNFLNDETLSKPLGFYTWSPDLEKIFRQDRMLQTPFEKPADVAPWAQALHDEPAARATYEQYLRLTDQLTNPHGSSQSLAPLLRALDGGGTESLQGSTAFFPASRSHETDLVKKLFGNRPIPEGFQLIDELIDRIRDGKIDLKPTEKSGWYDHQTYALEPLAIPEKTPEAARLRYGPGYRKILINLFRGILALTRETHVKQLEMPRAGAAMNPRVVIPVSPDLTLEPLATMYLRRAQSYTFIRNVITTAFGPDAARQWHRQTANGPVTPNLADELTQIETIHYGAYASVMDQLGLPPEHSPDWPRNRLAQNDAEAYRNWIKNAENDPDLSQDARMMVPVFYDVQRKATKVWLFLGWRQEPVTVGFVAPPKVEVLAANGQPAPPNSYNLKFTNQFALLPYPVTAEIYVTKILNRTEFRNLCDQWKSQAAILEHLQ